ncbi:MAG: uracil-DNA glycosylase family protein [Chloroflexota bacterium]
MASSTDGLLIEVARCPIVASCIASETRTHVCSEVVLSQECANIAEFKVPEPWSGDLENAPILFLSSNPTIDTSDNPEVYPTSNWPDTRIEDYFKNRFGGGQEPWTNDLRNQRSDGSYSRKGRYWSAVDARAAELLGRRPVPGTDYSLSEVVHCKSDGEIGVEAALQECAPRWLRRVLELAGATVVVCLGVRARAAMQELAAFGDAQYVSSTDIGGKRRALVFLPHPNARIRRSFKACLTPPQLAELQALCQQ